MKPRAVRAARAVRTPRAMTIADAMPQGTPPASGTTMLPTTGMNHAGCTCMCWICASVDHARTTQTVTTAMAIPPARHNAPETLVA